MHHTPAISAAQVEKSHRGITRRNPVEHSESFAQAVGLTGRIFRQEFKQ
jgi:hypothetical protein